MGMLLIAAIAFVGSHFLLSHPLRRPIVARLGERGFLGLYSLVAVATLGWLVVAFRDAPYTATLWPVGGVLWAIAMIVMLVASILLAGSFFGNPALPDPTGAAKPVPQASGVFAITRHPMLWSFALWGAAHILVMPTAATIVLAGAIIILSLVGASAQDEKKERLQPDIWPAWEAQTSYWPFVALASGRTSGALPSIGVVIGGTLLWLGATWAHIPLVGVTAGVWNWLQ
jgi:uncharacterized membrane protein